MKKSISLAAMVLMLGFVGNSNAAQGMYVSGNIGISSALDSDTNYKSGALAGTTSSSTFDNGLALNASLGYALSENVRLEGEIGYQKSDFDQQTYLGVTYDASAADMTTWSFIGNIYYDFANDSSFTPYVTAGFGFANVEIDNSAVNMSADDTVPVAQFGAGVGYALNDKVSLDFRYRYLLAISDPEFSFSTVTGESEMASHMFTVGIRVGF